MKSIKSAICLTVRNENPGIAEWVAHYTNLGADQLIIYDDQSTDGTRELLERLREHFPITVIDWKSDAKSRQIAAYQDCLTRFSDDYDWIAFIDADEFLIPPTNEKLPDLLARHADHEAIALNWLIFGTNNIANLNGHLVMESFTQSSEDAFPANKHIKSIIRPQAVTGVVNPHYFAGPKYYDVMGNEIKEWQDGGIIRQNNYVSGSWILNHYVLRSGEHIDRRKKRSLSTAHNVNVRGPEFYTYYDRNEVVNFNALKYAEAAKALLISFGFGDLFADEQPVAYNENLNYSVNIDSIAQGRIRGWVHNLKGQDVSPRLQFYIGEKIIEIECNQFRPDLKAAGLYSRSGFDFALPAEFLNGEDHTLYITTPIGERIWISSNGQTDLSKKFSQKLDPEIIGHIDGFRGAELNGWVFVRNIDGTKSGEIPMVLTRDGEIIAEFTADASRSDVAGQHDGAPKYCGIKFQLPEAHRRVTTSTYRVFPKDYEDVEIPGSSITHSFAPLQSSRNGTGVANWMLDDYHQWIQLKDAELRQRTAAMGNVDLGTISIVCPVYKPNLAHFQAAINSVLGQTYTNWELILVNDGSHDKALSNLLNTYALSDPRIRVVHSSGNYRNMGIATATNRGIAKARGEHIVFFDQDDVMYPVALQVMKTQAQKTGAKLLYSDEDKIRDGIRYDPALKPDWNWRLALGVNFICHMVMVDVDTLRAAGPLSPRYDGAQDHELILRLSLVVPDEEISHVAEILYSWRAAAGSTAEDVSAKPKAIEAGRQAISDHLERRGLPAIVSSLGNNTQYRVDWGFQDSPRVRIIVPFREGIEMTKDCLDRVLSFTDYKNYEVVLVDNGSTSQEARDFCEYAEQDDRVRVLHIDEPFNFSMLNNRAARLKPESGTATPEMFVLLNNDLHVADKNWLRVMVNEALADPKVGIVGGKLRYEDGSIQHAGTIIGLGGVAGHFYQMPNASTPGYMGRALLAQEFSAVTAACMLVRADAFWQVGGLEETLPVAFNDVDLCLKIGRELGMKIIMSPDFVVHHLESQSRGSDTADPVKYRRFVDAFNYMQQRWGQDQLDRDPFSHPYFSLNNFLPFERLTDPTLPPSKSDRPLITAAPQYEQENTVTTALPIGNILLRQCRSPQKGSVAVIYFGIVRDLSQTIGGIQNNIIYPLEASGASYVSIASLNMIDQINSARSGEINVQVNSADCFKLGADRYILTPQRDAEISDTLAIAKTQADPFGNEYASVNNLLHQLASLERGWKALHTLEPRGFDFYYFIRPDLLYLNPFNYGDFQSRLDSPNSILVPAWHSFGGLNDRFAVARWQAAEAYATRFSQAAEFCATQPLHSETFVAWAMARGACSVGELPVEAKRVRANGTINNENFSVTRVLLPQAPEPFIYHLVPAAEQSLPRYG